MTLFHLLIRAVYSMPSVVRCLFHIGCTLLHRMLVKTVERCLIDNIDGSFGGVKNAKSIVLHADATVSSGSTDDGTEVNALLRIANSVSRYGDLVVREFSLIRHKCAGAQLIVHLSAISSKMDGYEFIGITSQILFLVSHSIAPISVAAHSLINVELPIIIICGIVEPVPSIAIKVADVKRSQGHVITAVRSLHMKLQRVGLCIVFLEQSFANLGNPFVGICIHLAVVRPTCPQCDVIQFDTIHIGSTIDKCAQFPVSYRQ